MENYKIRHNKNGVVTESQVVPLNILTRQEAADRLRLKPEQISELIRKRARNPLPFVKFGKAVRFVAADLDAWILRQRQGRAA